MSKRKKRGWERLEYTPEEARTLIRRMVAEGKLPHVPPPSVPPPTREEVEARFKELEAQFPEEVSQARKKASAFLQELQAMRDDKPLVLWARRK